MRKPIKASSKTTRKGPPPKAYSAKAKAAEVGLTVSTPQATRNMGKKTSAKVTERSPKSRPSGPVSRKPSEVPPGAAEAKEPAILPANKLGAFRTTTHSRAPKQPGMRPMGLRQLGMRRKAVGDAPLVPKRLNKAIADSGMCSRREADRWIEEGRVQVNFETPKVGQTVTVQDIVLVDGHALPKAKHWVIAFHKPAGTLTTRSDDRDRRTIYDELPKKYHTCDPAGRLDKASSGLLLMTNDGDLLQKLMHPKFLCPKVYRVRVNRPVAPDAVKQLKTGVVLVDEERGTEQVAKAHQVVIEDECSLTITLYTGLNRQIRRSLEVLGYHVMTLRRMAVGPVQLKNLPVGKARELSREELRALNKLLG